MSRAIERLERRAQLGRQQLRLFPRRETPRENRQYDGNALVGVGPGVKVLWLNRLVCPARAVPTHDSRKKRTGQAGTSLSRFRDLLPSRHTRAARLRASGISASE